MWAFVRDQPRGEPVAYSNTHFVYPLYGFELDRRIEYVPTRSGLVSWTDLPPLHRALPGEQIQHAVVEALTDQSDREQWLGRVLASGARFLFIGKGDLSGGANATPPELHFARDDAEHFIFRIENEAAAIFEIVRR